MTVDQLRELLEGVEDTRELVMEPGGEASNDELFTVWCAARAEANSAYERWRRTHSSEAYWHYRASEDRADAAQDALGVRQARDWSADRKIGRQRGGC